MNKRAWRKRARRYKKSWYYYIELLKKAEGDIGLAEERLLRQGIRELSIDEGIAQLCKDRYALREQAKELMDRSAILGESHTAAVDDYNALLAWQRRVREAWEAYVGVRHLSGDPKTLAGALRQAIESNLPASEFDFKAYMTQVEKWGKAEAEPKERHDCAGGV